LKLAKYLKFSLKCKFLSKSLLFFAPLLLLPYSISLQALSAQTSGVIQGTAPYLTFDDGATKIMSVEGLLGIKLPNSSYIPPGINSPLYPNAIIDTSSMDNPIEMPNITDTFASIQTMVPIENYPEIPLTKLVNSPYNYGRDDDGDGDNNFNATGNLTIKWQNNSGVDITNQVKNSPNTILNFCDAPYKLTITATGGILSTSYGIPNSSTFTGNSHSYYINPNKDSSITCYAQPNLFADNLGLGYTFEDFYGPDWFANKGFKVSDVSNTTTNFPTTGSNNLFFYLLLGGITPEQVIAANGNTVYATNGSGVNLLLSKEKTPKWGNISAYTGGVDALKIVLQGPDRYSGNKGFSPSLFKLYSDSNHNKLLYSFKIERWYIAQPGDGGGYANARSFCQNLGYGYRVPDINDYTNSNGNDWFGGIPGRDFNNYQRRVSYRDGSGKWIGGLFNEWGYTLNSHYSGSDWEGVNFWTAQPYHDGRQYHVNPDGGYVGMHYPYQTYDRAACVTP
jgi:hypothetical protein